MLFVFVCLEFFPIGSTEVAHFLFCLTSFLYGFSMHCVELCLYEFPMGLELCLDGFPMGLECVFIISPALCGVCLYEFRMHCVELCLLNFPCSACLYNFSMQR